MDPMPVIFDISSDDEAGCDETKGDDYDWLSEVLKSVDDSDDVVVVSEVNPRKRTKFSQQVEKDFDGDCVILDGDPDKQLGIVNEPVTESDELLIVGEKGQVACRDFPHSRQHCAKFPFNSTPHESHCDLCHCYVCDSIAPCIHWGDGCLNIDHCHATEKEETWKILRKSLRLGKSSRSSVLKLPDTSHSMPQPQLNQVSHMSHIGRFNQVSHHSSVQPSTILQSTSNSILQNQVSRPTPFRACTSSTNIGVPSVRSHGAGYQPQQVLAKNRGQQHLVPQQLVGLSSDIVRKEKDRNIGNLGTQFVPSHRTVQRSGSVRGALQMNQSGYDSSYSNNQAQAVQQSGNLPILNDRSGWLATGTNMNSESGTNQNFSQTSIENIFLNTLPSQPQVPSTPISQIQGNQQPQVEHFQLENAVLEYEPLPLEESNPQFHISSSNLSLPDFEFENWLLENDPVPGIADNSGPPIDAGIYFDFETSWNGLTHA